MFDYNAQGEVTALSFAINFDGKMVGFRLPARIDQVEAILKREDVFLRKKRGRNFVERISTSAIEENRIAAGV